MTTVPPRSDWRGAVASFRAEPRHGRILGGSLILLFGSGLVSLVNFGYNVVVARLMGPSGFGHAAVAVTLLMLFSCLTLAYQLVAAKFIARSTSPEVRAGVYWSLLKRSWKTSIVLACGLALSSKMVAEYLHLPSPTLIAILAIGIAFYLPLGVKRGGLQGTCAFMQLSWNFILEAAVKFVAAFILIQMGFGTYGAVAAISASVILAYFIPRTPQELRIKAPAQNAVSFSEGMQAIVFFVGQVVINNIDVVLVKHYFSAEQAGVYAAVALVGRVIYFASWSVISAMFPISAGSKAKDDENSSVLVIPLLIVLGIALVFILGLERFSAPVVNAVFGAGFSAAADTERLLSLYAAATGAYSLSVVLMAYEMSRRLANTGWLQLVVSGAIVVGISVFHADLHQVVLVQLVLMVALLMIVSIPFFRTQQKTLAVRQA